MSKTKPNTTPLKTIGWGITSDNYSWKVFRKAISNKGEELNTDTTYHPTLEQAVKYLAERVAKHNFEGAELSLKDSLDLVKELRELRAMVLESSVDNLGLRTK